MLSIFTGWAVVATWLGYLLQLTGWLPLWLLAILGWLACALLWPRLSQSAKRQAGLLLGGGVLALGFAAFQGVYVPWSDILAVNLPLLAMFVAVSFLSLAARSAESSDLPTGKSAMATTAIGMNLLGAVINLSVLFIFGDRLQRNGRLTEPQQIVLARCFCAAAWWSPFFVATGVALTYSPEMNWKTTLIPGLMMAIIALSFTMLDLYRRREVADFEGYPIRWDSLVMPCFLAAMVMIAHQLWPSVSVIALICIFAPLGSALFMVERPRLRSAVDFVHNRLSNIGNQFALFLAAGVFSSGVKAILLVYPALVSFDNLVFDSWLFLLISGVMIAVGMLGVHPVVTIAIVSPLLLPLNPDPNMLAFLFLTTWAVATASSPLSGFGLALVSRYQATPMGVVRNNWYYAVLMWLGASGMSYLMF